jgi:hypothetical protein
MSLQQGGFGKSPHSNAIISPATAAVDSSLTAGTPVPASGSFVDVSGGTYAWILVRWGGIAGSDAPTLEIKVSDANNGTLDSLSPQLIHTGADDDDNEYVSFYVRVDGLPADHNFIAVEPGGTITAVTADIMIMVDGYLTPVTQTTTVLPAASQYTWDGNQIYQPS